jgi:hypothetical protein
MNGRGQRIRDVFNRDLIFVHRFQQRALCFRRRAIDFIGQHNIGEDRTRLEFELILLRIENRNAEHVGWQQVAGELNSMEPAIQRSSQRMTEGGLSHTRHIFNQQMTFGNQRDHRKFDGFVLALYNFADRSPKRLYLFLYC